MVVPTCKMYGVVGYVKLFSSYGQLGDMGVITESVMSILAEIDQEKDRQCWWWEKERGKYWVYE